ncbi:MAG: hypothetical protein HC842_00520 [Cytophagales bacterium]|nr:hypothetical protein [Cytophagales bacterium]
MKKWLTFALIALCLVALGRSQAQNRTVVTDPLALHKAKIEQKYALLKADNTAQYEKEFAYVHAEISTLADRIKKRQASEVMAKLQASINDLLGLRIYMREVAYEADKVLPKAADVIGNMADNFEAIVKMRPTFEGEWKKDKVQIELVKKRLAAISDTAEARKAHIDDDLIDLQIRRAMAQTDLERAKIDAEIKALHDLEGLQEMNSGIVDKLTTEVKRFEKEMLNFQDELDLLLHTLEVNIPVYRSAASTIKSISYMRDILGKLDMGSIAGITSSLNAAMSAFDDVIDVLKAYV